MITVITEITEIDKFALPRSAAGDPMTLGNMRANDVRSLDVSC
jgi:hypothetical protein